LLFATAISSTLFQTQLVTDIMAMYQELIAIFRPYSRLIADMHNDRMASLNDTDIYLYIWRRAINLTSRPLFPSMNILWYKFDKRLGEPQSRSVRYGDNKIFNLTGTLIPILRYSSPWPVIVPTAFSYFLSESDLQSKSHLPF
jgi:hypothetical protein